MKIITDNKISSLKNRGQFILEKPHEPIEDKGDEDVGYVEESVPIDVEHRGNFG